jgi:small subunit ribosomal protein S4|tara:strand:+ start:554 stop:1096 length:543 start_codon:yes stop_codon:yes gene_type:complete
MLGSQMKKRSLYPSQQWYKYRLSAKQKVKGEFGFIKDQQLRKLFKQPDIGINDNSLNTIQILETRLDLILYRMGFAESLFKAHQLINHGFVLVNGIKTHSKSFNVKKGDFIEINPRYWDLVFKEVHSRFKKNSIFMPAPKYLEINYKLLMGILLENPTSSDLHYFTPLDIKSAKDFYTRG